MGVLGLLVLAGLVYAASSPQQRATLRALLLTLLSSARHAVHTAGQPAPGVTQRAAVTSGQHPSSFAAAPAGAHITQKSSATDVSTWTCSDVASWLAAVELSEHTAAFLSASVDGHLLLCLSREDLVTLGVTSPLHVKKLQLRLAALHPGSLHWPVLSPPALPTRRSALLVEADNDCATLPLPGRSDPFPEGGSDSGTNVSGSRSHGLPSHGSGGSTHARAADDAATCVGLLRGHGGWVTTCAWCPDGALLAGSGDGPITMWDSPDSPIAPPAPTAVLEGHAGAVRAIVPLSRRSTLKDSPVLRCASVGDDGTLRIWAVRSTLHEASSEPSNVCEAVVTAHGDAIYALLALPSSVESEQGGITRLLTCSADATARVWHLRTRDADAGAIVAGEVLQGHSDFVMAACQLHVTVDGEPPQECIVVTASWDSTLRVCPLPERSPSGDAPPACLRVLRGHRGGVRAVAPLPNWRCVSAGADGALRIWQPRASGAAERVLKTRGPDNTSLGAVLALTALPGGNEVACAREDGRVRLWRLSANDAGPWHRLDGHTKRVYSLATFQQGTHTLLASGSRDRTLRLWRLTRG